MSVGVTLISQCCDEYKIGTLVGRLNDWIARDPPCGGGRLIQIDEYYGGGKHPECLVWGAGFNYLSWQKFIEYALSLPWKEAVSMPEEQRIMLIVSPEQRRAEVHFLA